MISAPNIQSPQIQLLLKAGVIVLPNFLILSLVLLRFLPGESFLSATTKGVLTNTRTKNINHSVHFSSVQSLSHVRLCEPMDCSKPGLPVHWQLPEFTQTHVHPVMPSNHLILCHPLLLLPSVFPSNRVFFPVSQFFTSGAQSIRASASVSVLQWIFRNYFL